MPELKVTCKTCGREIRTTNSVDRQSWPFVNMENNYRCDACGESHFYVREDHHF